MSEASAVASARRLRAASRARPWPGTFCCVSLVTVDSSLAWAFAEAHGQSSTAHLGSTRDAVPPRSGRAHPGDTASWLVQVRPLLRVVQSEPLEGDTETLVRFSCSRWYCRSPHRRS